MVLDKENHESGEIYKSLNRVVVITNYDTVDISEWLEKRKIEIYKPTRKMPEFNFNQFESVIKSEDLKFVLKNYGTKAISLLLHKVKATAEFNWIDIN